MRSSSVKGRKYMHAIGIDIGTTSICGVLINVEDGRLLKSRMVSGDAFIRTDFAWEKLQDVNKIISIAQEILYELADEDTAVIGLTGQMHGILYTDEQGQAVSPLYTWQDQRGNLSFGNTTYAEYFGSCPGYGGVTDFYNRMNGIRPAEAVCCCTIADYLGMKLCGLSEPVIHSSNMTSFGNLSGMENKAEVTGDYRIIGEWSPQSGACGQGVKRIPVSVAIGDNQASVLSTLADERNMLINVGTGSQITVVSDAMVSGENIEARPYVEGKYLIVGAALCGGRAYSVLKNFYQMLFDAAGMKQVDVYGLMAKLVQDGKTLLTVDPRFAGTRSDPSLRGSITGIGTDNFTPSAVTRGVLAGMTEELYGMYQAMGLKREGIVGSGNGIRQNPELVRTIGKCFGGSLKIPVHKEEAAFGAALFALISCGVFENSAQAQTLIRYETDEEGDQ